jgi:hypothetical protein
MRRSVAAFFSTALDILDILSRIGVPGKGSFFQRGMSLEPGT